MGVKKNHERLNLSLEKTGVVLVRRKKRFEELITPTLLSSSFPTSVACLLKGHKILGGEKRRLLPGSALGQAGEYTGSVKAPA